MMKFKTCHKCGFLTTKKSYNYCPHHGANGGQLIPVSGKNVLICASLGFIKAIFYWIWWIGSEGMVAIDRIAERMIS